MTAGEPVAQALDCEISMDVRDDNSLLRAIAQDRDHLAFTELCERHQQHAFNFAFKILHNSALAEDIVQEAMLSLWLSDKSVQPEGSAGRLILSIVASKCLTIRRSQKRRTKREGYMAMEQSRSDGDVAQDVEDSELIAALRSHIEQLPDLERTLLACSYCASMPQQEIAKLVGLSQQSVSNKIQLALERLRTGLMRAGVATVVPLLSRENLFEAITTGDKCPPDMTEKVLQRIESNKATTRSLSRRTITARRGGWFPIAAGFAVLVTAAGGLWWAMSGQKQNAAVSDSPHVAVATVHNPDAPVHAPFSRTWNFNTPEQANDFEIVEGSWRWIPDRGPDGSGCMETGAGTFVTMVNIPRLPILITFRSNIVSTQPRGESIGVLWEKYRVAGYFKNVGREAYVPRLSWRTVRIYGTAHSLDCWIDEERFQLCAVDVVPGSRLRLGVRGQRRIDEFTVKAIAPNEVKDTSTYLSAVERIEPARREGTVLLPGLEGNDRTRPVSVEFVSMPAEAARTEP